MCRKSIHSTAQKRTIWLSKTSRPHKAVDDCEMTRWESKVLFLFWVETLDSKSLYASGLLITGTTSSSLKQNHHFHSSAQCLCEEADIMDFDLRASARSVKHLSAVQAARLHSGTLFFHLPFPCVVLLEYPFLVLFFSFFPPFYFLSYWVWLFEPWFSRSSQYSRTPLAIHIAFWFGIL